MTERATQRRLRLLAVQTSTGLTSEVRVFLALLEALPPIAGERGVAVDVLLVQGIDRGVGDAGRRTADAFRRLPHVTVRELDVGKLGRFDTAGVQRLAKVRDVAAVQLARRGLLHEARRFRPDLVYSAQQRWDLRLASPLAHALGVPQVVHLHYIVGPWLGEHAVDTLTKADMIIGVSDYIRDDAMRHGAQAERVHALYNSVVVPPPLTQEERDEARTSVRREMGLPGDALLVGMAARLSPSKGQVELLEAMRPILTRDGRVHLVLAGGEYPAHNGMTERLREAARAHGIGAQVHLLGQRTDVPRILDALDVFAHPSLEDPCPLAVLEAGAHSLPVVAWRDGGTATLVVDGETGLLVAPGDIDGLTAALERLIGDAHLRDTMGERARARMEAVYNPDIAAAGFLTLLQEAAGRRTGARQREDAYATN